MKTRTWLPVWYSLFFVRRSVCFIAYCFAAFCVTTVDDRMLFSILFLLIPANTGTKVPISACRVLIGIENGHIGYDGNLIFGTLATYSCGRGYDLIGNKVRICQRLEKGDGIYWSGTKPFCSSLGEHMKYLFH